MNLTKNGLRVLYYRQKLSLRQIASLGGVSDRTIGRWMDKYGLQKKIGFHPTFTTTHCTKGSKPYILHRLALHKQDEIAKFLDLIKPCIKKGMLAGK